jgi:hypothetical protein
VKNTFLSRIHLDGLWTTTSTDARFYGLVGSHISLVDVGRVQFFGPPGVIVLSIPDGHGSRQIRMGYTWGMSVRLVDVRLFAPSKNLTLFLSMTKVWIVGGTYDRRLRSGRLLARAAKKTIRIPDFSTPNSSRHHLAELRRWDLGVRYATSTTRRPRGYSIPSVLIL